ncbi:hypothetical protein [Natranaerobius trueperi]|uniref:Uncharacterized protein n=1 Tax=Natranaerobius trueperi TaxID=759412 RepID=A0A226BX16_9FIRM|nr:hypothetical protein [Natranaerobius trueperi]OWZ82657.1 hypothetical protein CDO51_12900 [Natranaerobius trueperi]
MSISDAFGRAYKTLKDKPGILWYSLVIMIIFYTLSLPMIIREGGFFSFGAGVTQFMAYLESFTFPSSPPGAQPVFGDVPGDMNTDIGFIPLVVSLLVIVFMTPAYLGIVRESIQNDQKPDLDIFLRYGKYYIWRIVTFLLIITLLLLVVGSVLGILGFFIALITNLEPTPLIEGILTLVGWVVSFYILFVEFEILERTKEDPLSDCITFAVDIVSNEKTKVLSYLVSFLIVGLITLSISWVLDFYLPLVISIIIIPVLNTSIITFLIVTMYHLYYDLSDIDAIG